MSLVKETLKAKAWFAGLNWQFILVKLGLVAAILVGVYFKGRHDMETHYLELQAKSSQRVVEEVRDFLPAVQRQEQRAAQLNARIEEGLKNYDEAISKAGDNPSCNLTDDELREFKSLAED